VVDHGRKMFERCTERARRVLFFARDEASQLGSASIDAAHLLLGLIREGKGVTSRIFAESHLSLEGIRKQLENERRSLALRRFSGHMPSSTAYEGSETVAFWGLRGGELTGSERLPTSHSGA
jgi:ATP-dependent Clp protease ATP-binding subunit ClpA